ncbi:MAG: hypothetical protein RRA15_02555 [bacterium]|nr:hypothetical protein [bacterium]MDT8365356.1 hypothetical protein [bacterium]
MNIETFQIPTFLTVILALSSMLVIPVAAMALSKIPLGISAKTSDAPDGAACALPFTVELEGKTAEPGNGQLPPMDKKATGNIKTGTFAMG